jgi:glycine dehydrogenase subunit 1
VPAVVDEVIGRSEFLTAYAGEPYEDHGRVKVLFVYNIAE